MTGEVFECCILQQNRNDQEARRLRKSMITKDFSRIVAYYDNNRILQQKRRRCAPDSCEPSSADRFRAWWAGRTSSISGRGSFD